MATPCGLDEGICLRGSYGWRHFAGSMEAMPRASQRKPKLDSGEVYQNLRLCASEHNNGVLECRSESRIF
jgi:hypothetical protein